VSESIRGVPSPERSTRGASVLEKRRGGASSMLAASRSRLDDLRLDDRRRALDGGRAQAAQSRRPAASARSSRDEVPGGAPGSARSAAPHAAQTAQSPWTQDNADDPRGATRQMRGGVAAPSLSTPPAQATQAGARRAAM